ncbi:MAG: SAM-dependent methyltransferase [Chloroflexota bacterium]|nr:SAM-dependent methyltransferase [Chloroflexota bacterium]MDE2961808.1 SAM-dependent methyltransferase [Chloroflexota bacterium]
MVTAPAATDLPPSPAERAIRRRIARHGPITFAEYMARALYGPGGYYTRSGAGDDYYTSPQVHPAFGALLAVQLFRCWELLDRPDPFFVIEPGAGDGLLGRDISNAAGHLPEGFGGSLRYVAVDRRPGGREARDPTFAKIAGDALRPPFRNVTGCIVSNELLDALPVHRVCTERGTLREIYVGIESDVADGYEGQLVEVVSDPSTPNLERRLSDIGVNLSDGQTAEICLLLDDWAASVASSLDTGFVLTIDYGRSAHDLYDPIQRPHGTLVTYRSHRQTDTPLVDPGRQDITAQVDFTSVGLAGERAGLTTLGNVSQGRLLTRLGLQTIRRSGAPPAEGSSGWITIPIDPEGALPDVLAEPFAPQPDASRDWLTGLTHLVRPGGLGDFRVLVQARGLPAERAASALSWLEDDPAGSGYAPSTLAAMIPAEALALGPERFRLGR